MRRCRSDLSKKKRRRRRSRTGDSTKATGDIVVLFPLRFHSGNSTLQQASVFSATSRQRRLSLSFSPLFSLLRLNNVTPSGMFRTVFRPTQPANKALCRLKRESDVSAGRTRFRFQCGWVHQAHQPSYWPDYDIETASCIVASWQAWHFSSIYLRYKKNPRKVLENPNSRLSLPEATGSVIEAINLTGP